MKQIKTLTILFILILSIPITLSGQSTKWVGTWGCAPYAAGSNTPPSPYLANNTLRQIVRVSIGGDSLRIKFSNITSPTPVIMNSVNIAVSNQKGASSVDASTITQLSFAGKQSVTMDAYSSVLSDPFAFPLESGMHLAITIYYGDCETNSNMTFHYGSRTDSYILKGDQSASEKFTGATKVERWYHINSIDVLTSEEAATVVVYGNSITDGYGLHGGLKNTWSDIFSEQLLNNDSTAHVGVVNMGIGGTLISTSGVARFHQDVLSQAGLRWILIFYGVNDIGANKTTQNIIGAFQNLIAQAHAQNIRVYAATITPFGGSGYYSTAHEKVRSEVNAWIMESGNVDASIDFDKAIRDETDTTKMLKIYSNDWLHPNADGYKKLGESVNLNLFLGADTIFPQPDMSHIEKHIFEAECLNPGNNWNIKKDANASNNAYINVKPGIESLNSASTDEDNIVSFDFNVKNDSTYFIYARLNCPTANDDSYWIKVDDGNFIMYNGLVTSGWQWIPIDSYYFAKGDHSVSITYREDGAKLDKICISSYSFAPTGLGDDAGITCEVIETEIPSSLAKFDNSKFKIYPNPFIDSIYFELNLGKTEQVEVKMFNTIGVQVATIFNEQLGAGLHKIKWDAKNASGGKLKPGMYFYQIVIGTELIKGKIEIIK